MTTSTMRTISNNATHATTDTVINVRGEQKFRIIAQHILIKLSSYSTIVPEQQTAHKLISISQVKFNTWRS